MAIPNPNPNIADGMKCDNKTYSSNKIEDLVSAAGGDDPRIPDAEVADIGKVLGIVSDGASGAEYDAVSIPNEVPSPAVGDIGKVLGVVSDGSSGAEYGAVAVPSDIVFIEFPDDYPEDIDTLPEGVTGEYIYNLVHEGKRVILACGTDYNTGDGRFLIPVYNVYKRSDTYYARACLVIPDFSGNPSALDSVGCYSITISNSTVSSAYEYFNIPT